MFRAKFMTLQGYQEELKQAFITFQESNRTNEADKLLKFSAIKKFGDEQLLALLSKKRLKTKLSPHWASIIADLPDERRLPGEIRKLFMAIDLVINQVCEVKDEG